MDYSSVGEIGVKIKTMLCSLHRIKLLVICALGDFTAPQLLTPCNYRVW